jgi:hypothetical protein
MSATRLDFLLAATVALLRQDTRSASEVLSRFLEHRDEAAFEALVVRHRKPAHPAFLAMQENAACARLLPSSPLDVPDFSLVCSRPWRRSLFTERGRLDSQE